MIVAVVVLFVLAISMRGVADFYTDFLWFKSLKETGVWSGVLGAKLALGAIFIFAAFLLIFVNLWIADRTAPVFGIATTEDEVVLRFHEIFGRRRGLLRAGIAVVLGLIIGGGASSQWNNWILYNHRVDFATKDATFHTNIGFYVFQLPFLEFLVSWLFVAVLVSVLIVLVADYFNGSIQVQAPAGTHLADRFNPRVKVHVSVLLAMLALVKTAQYWLGRYNLAFSTRGTVDGALYTDTNVQLKSIYLLLMISVFACVLFLVNIWRRGWVLPAMAVGLWGVVSIVAGIAVPAFVQRFRVEPAESTMEAPYLQHNITATRTSFGLDKIKVQSFANDGQLTAPKLQDNKQTVQNVRLWDPAVMQEVFNRLQGIRSFYNVGDPDVDRYRINGQMTQVLTANRDIDSSALPQKSWQAQHLAYTHGFGNILAAANAADRGQPVFTNKDIPVVTKGTGTKVRQPSTYFGEGLAGYVITNSKTPEINYTDASGDTKFTHYSGADGIKLGSGLSGFVNKAALSIRFTDINPLISTNVTSKSKVLMYRDVRQRVQTLAPFLSFDADPYVVVRADGRLDYVIDGFTTTKNYPNAQRAITADLASDSGLNRRFNYVRNSVKAVVDAYNGTVKLYVVDNTDPIIQAYEKAFPKLFTSDSKVPADLRAHFRYPEDLFKVQTAMYGRYHLTTPSGFYTQENGWQVAADPNTAGIANAAAVPGAVDANGNPINASDHPMDPYYLLMRLPGDKTESFLLLRPFVPNQGGAVTKQLLTGFMTAQSDPSNYGELTVYQLPANNLPSAPYNIAAQMMQDKKVSTTQSLLCNSGSSGGSECEYGNLLLIPIDQSLLYVRPWYVKASGNSLPELQQVIVGYQDSSGNTQVAVESTLRGALVDLFGNDVPSTRETNPLAAVNLNTVGAGGGSGTASTTTTTSTPTTTVQSGPTTTVTAGNQTVAQLVAQLNDAFAQANIDLGNRDLGAYANDIARAQALAAQLKAKQGGG